MRKRIIYRQKPGIAPSRFIVSRRGCLSSVSRLCRHRAVWPMYSRFFRSNEDKKYFGIGGRRVAVTEDSWYISLHNTIRKRLFCLLSPPLMDIKARSSSVQRTMLPLRTDSFLVPIHSPLLNITVCVRQFNLAGRGILEECIHPSIHHQTKRAYRKEALIGLVIMHHSNHRQ